MSQNETSSRSFKFVEELGGISEDERLGDVADRLRQAIIVLGRQKRQQEIIKSVTTSHLLSLRAELAEKSSVAVAVTADTECSICRRPLNSTVCTLAPSSDDDDREVRIQCVRCHKTDNKYT